MIRVLIADDHEVVREGLRLILSKAPNLQVQTMATKELAVSSSPLPDFWDVLLLDITVTRDSDGLELLRRMRQLHSALPVLVISVHSEEECGVRALKAGAAGYIRTTSSPAEVVRAIHKVAAHGRYISPLMAERLAERLDQSGEQPAEDILSTREFEVFMRLAAGERPSAIARSLGLSIKTISTHRSRILDKLNLKTNCHLVHYAIQRNLVGLNGNVNAEGFF
jgi:DNA-binding NarL/FixJ family response regulator